MCGREMVAAGNVRRESLAALRTHWFFNNKIDSGRGGQIIVK